MSRHIQIAVNNLCHENWDNMTRADKGRFCASCQKKVTDFTDMSDSQIAAFFKRPGDISVCGRFYEDQLNRTIEIPKKRIPWIKYFFQFLLPAFLISIKATAQGNVKADKIVSRAIIPAAKNRMDSVPAARRIIIPSKEKLEKKDESLQALVFNLDEKLLSTNSQAKKNTRIFMGQATTLTGLGYIRSKRETRKLIKIFKKANILIDIDTQHL